MTPCPYKAHELAELLRQLQSTKQAGAWMCHGKFQKKHGRCFYLVNIEDAADGQSLARITSYSGVVATATAGQRVTAVTRALYSWYESTQNGAKP